MNEEFLRILENIEREKGISREILFSAVESALASAARKVVGKRPEDVEVKIDRKTGQIKVLSDGKKIESSEFGRIAAQTAKQVIIQKIREAERDVIYEEFSHKAGSIVTGSVHRFERGDIVIDLGKTEAILPRNQQCPRENYRQGDRIKGYILEVNKTPRGPQIIVSRTNPGIIKKLFELEVPEIAEGIVEIKSISREASVRTKVAVRSKEERVDAVGACVGMRGQRVKNIVREINGERLDIIKWSDDIREYVKSALSPAEISKINVNSEKKSLEIIVKDDQLSLAIGKHGQNVRIASKLTGWDIDIRSAKRIKELADAEKEKAKKKRAKYPKGTKRSPAKSRAKRGERSEGKAKQAKGEVLKKTKAKEKTPTVAKLDGVGKKTYEALIAAGFDTIERIAASSLKDLTKIKGIAKKGAEKILNSAREKVGQ